MPAGSDATAQVLSGISAVSWGQDVSDVLRTTMADATARSVARAG